MTRPPAGDARIAVVGMACRLPGAPDPAALWRLLADGRQAVGEIPAERLELAGIDPDDELLAREPGARLGAFLDGVDRFDAAFFGISPREAAAMDPQQRLALELAWEALEDAGTVPGAIGGAEGGVFLGAIAGDYAQLVQRRVAAAASERHAFTGLQRGMIANRVSYALGLTGPSMTVDTAQSSSLVAVHLARESLLRGEVELALAGGVHLNVDPRGALGASRFGGLSPDGRCFTFDARANGYARGEGGGVVVLKTLAAARADGDRVYGILAGSAVTNDGASEGLTVPSPVAQEAALRRACRDAGVSPADVQYVELHGTGTAVGDPVEAAALGAALGAGRDAGDRLVVGSVKTNVGHLEGAAGIAGLIKALLAVGHRQIPASLNFETPSPAIPFDELRLRVSRELGAWPRGDRPLVAGVSSFGIGGTNCHVVLAEAPAVGAGAEPTATADRPAQRSAARGPAPLPGAVLLPLSAKSEPALREAASRLLARLQAQPDLDLAGVGRALGTTRSAFDRRAVVVGADREEAIETLTALAAGDDAPGRVRGVAAGDRRRPVFVFPGQGGQWAGMAVGLLGASALFAERMEACEQALAPFVDWSLRAVLRGEDGAPSLDRIEVLQPALFAVTVSLTELWRACGVVPAAVVGHSQGEIAAAHAAGALSLDDAARLAALRSRIIAKLAGAGAMASVAAGLDELEPRLARWPGRIFVAGVNGPRSLTVSGDRAALAELIADCERDGVRAREIPATVASHSPAVEPLREELLEALAPIAPRSGDVPFYSTVSGERADTAELGPEYWYRNLREPVRLADVTRRLLADGHRALIEIGPHPLMGLPLQQTVEQALDGEEVAILGTLRRDDGGAERFALSLAEAWAAGVDVDWSATHADAPTERVALPTYPFQRRRHWIEALTRPERDDAAAAPVTARAADDGHAEPADDGARHDAPDAELAALPAAEREARLICLIRVEAAAVLGHGAAESVPIDASFRDLGFDSRAALELRGRIVAATGLRIPSTLVFDHPSVARLARSLAGTPGATGGSQDVAGVAARDEPIAIVGMACRYPGGVDSPDDLWKLVAEGRDAIGELPTDRGWELGDGAGRRGGFLHDAPCFDAGFFGISPGEALEMDPQQRLLLEVCWEALEDAGIDPASLWGTPTGVFAGISSQDYGSAGAAHAAGGEGYRLTGRLTSVVSGRVAYSLGLEGPAMTVDTACSSSLVALHLAARALRQGDCSLALAGGVTVLATPSIFDEFDDLGGLAPDGRCKSFAEAADGTGWSEGVGVVMLERLSDARRNGHPVLAIVRGSAVNQDGASHGLTAPRGLSQENVIRQALADAGLAPEDVDAVEAHGTGTALGDPIEAGALLATYGRERGSGPLRLGSVKSNIGHTQAAAGVAGVIKMVMAMRAGVLPKTLHVDRPSSHVDWADGAVELLTEEAAWDPGEQRPRRAGVSSFGISGTNAHLVLEQAPEPAAAAAHDQGPSEPEAVPLPGCVLLPLSAKSEPALRAAGRRLLARLKSQPDLELADVGLTLGTARASFDHRAAVVGAGRDDVLAALAALAEGASAAGVIRGEAGGDRRPVFVFPGQGAQWQGMAAELLDGSPPFAERIEACEQALEPHVDWSLRAVLRGEDAAAALDRLDVVQPVLFAVTVSLAGLWRALGVEPAAVVGHSQGEVAAAHVAGALTLADAARAIALRGRAVARIAGQGGMASVSLSLPELLDRLRPLGGRVALAATNGPTDQVVSGEPAALDELLAACAADGVRAQRIAVDYAAHSTQIEALRDELLEALAPIAPRGAEIPFYSTVSGEPIDTAELGAEYWYRNLREPVRLEPVVRSLLAEGRRTFLEISPHPVLAVGIQETADAAVPDGEIATLATLRRDEGGPERFARSVAAAHAAGVDVDWKAFYGGDARRVVKLPTYPFQRRRYWIAPRPMGADIATAGLDRAGHPLLGARVELPEGRGWLFTGRLSLHDHPWLADHAVDGVALLAGTAFLELALHAASVAGLPTVEELTLQTPLVLPDQGALQLQVEVGQLDPDGTRPLTIASRSEPTGEPGNGSEWTVHASGTLAPTATHQSEPQADPEQPGDAIHAQAALPPEQRDQARRYHVHPALLDAALQAAGIEGAPFSFLHARVGAGAGASELHLRIDRAGEHVAVRAADPSGALVCSIATLVSRPLDTSGPAGRNPLLVVEWSEAASSSDGTASVELFECAAREIEEPPPAALRARCLELSARLRTFLTENPEPGSRLAILTRGAVAGGQALDLAAAALWGMVRSAQSEDPGRFVLVDSDGTSASQAALPTALASGLPQLALREGKLLAPHAARSRAAVGQGTPVDPEATVLITGGTGSLGALLARHLVVRHGARRLLLASRRGAAAPGASELRAELERLGARVALAACDVSDRDQLASLIETIPAAHPLSVVIHAAGALDSGTAVSIDAKRLDRAFGPKVDGAWHLHELTEALELEHFVLLSSTAGTLGSRGRAGYAAANAFLDALAQRRRAAGLPATSIAFGLWGRASEMAAGLSEAERALTRRSGLEELSDEHGLALFDAALDADLPFALALRLDPLARRAQAGALPPMLSSLVRVPADRRRSNALMARLTGLAPGELRGATLELVLDEVAAILDRPSASGVPSDRAFKELGFDSLAAVELRNRLRAATGLRLPTTSAFDHPTPAKLAAYLASLIAPKDEDGRPGDVAADANDLADASDDEIFALLDEELKRS